MSRAAKLITAAVILVPIAAIAVAVLNAPSGDSGEKSYHFSSVEIDATLRSDGTLALRERRTFDFRGPFSFAFFTIDSRHAPSRNIRGFTVRDQDGTVLQDFPTVENGDFKSTWYFDARDERRTFTISYRVRCAADVYRDAAHLLWQFVGVGWTEPTDLVRVDLRVPERAVQPPPRPSSCPASGATEPRETVSLTRGEVRAWGHGPLNGNVRITDEPRVIFTVRDLQPGQFVEGSVLLPPETVALMPAQPETRRDAILAEEARLADEANALRRQHDFETLLVKALFGLVPAAMLGLLVLARRRDRVPGIPEMLQEPPDDIHPVELAVLWSVSRKRLKPKDAYRAQFLHLARTGTITLAPVGAVADPEDFEIRRGRERGSDRAVAASEPAGITLEAGTGAAEAVPAEPDGGEPSWDGETEVSELDAVEEDPEADEPEEGVVIAPRKSRSRKPLEMDRRFLEFLFAEQRDGSVSLREVRAKGIRRGLLQEWWKAVGRKAKQKVKTIQRGIRRLEGSAMMVLAIGASVYGWWRSFGFDESDDFAFRGLVGPLALWLIPVSVVSFFLFRWLLPPRLPERLRKRMARWAAFRRFLEDFSTLDEAPTLAVVIWERYLVYAVALGVADEVERQVRALVPAELLPEPWPGAPAGDDGWRTYHSWHSSARSYSATGAAAAVGWSGGWGTGSSGGGGGGGFSGGGGGGGGGTGGGAG